MQTNASNTAHIAAEKELMSFKDWTAEEMAAELTTVGVHGEEHANRDSEKEQTEVVLRYVWNFLFQTCTERERGWQPVAVTIWF